MPNIRHMTKVESKSVTYPHGRVTHKTNLNLKN
uniref:Uncharacterized protein n=1 Tax=Siphoviridae sp. ctMOb8 TaxID=2825460 RepID=A0A8S5PZI1_9CAUD|nr:MAG TPA: hypothetical protein [Siphoviridae sp. ctMOb8]